MKVLKHLKAYWLPIIFIVLLLFAQAYCDLAMPEYMSNIVDVGIMQGGVTSIAPKKIVKPKMDDLNLLMYKEDSEFVQSLYEPGIYKGEDTYIIEEDINEENTEKLENILVNPMLIMQITELQKAGKLDSGNYAAEFGENFKSELGGLPEDVDLFQALASIPYEGRVEIIEGINKQIVEYEDSLGEENINQMLISYVKTLNKEAGVNTDKMQNTYIIKAGLVMIGYALIVAVTAILSTLLASRVGSGFSRDLRGSVYKKVISFSNKELNEFSSASLITRSTNDIQQIQIVVILFLRLVLYAPIIGFGALTKVLNSGAAMSWVILLAVVLILVVSVTLIAIAMPKFTKLQKLIDRINLVSREILTGLPVIRAFSREKHEEKRFDKANTDLMKTNLFVNRTMTLMMPTMMLIMNGISVLIIWVGAGHIDAGEMQIGEVMAFIQYTMQIIMAFLMLTIISVMLPRAIVSTRRVSEVLNADVSIEDPEDGDLEEFNESKKGIVEFKDVSFKYPSAEKCVIENINFTAEPGKTTAFIGSTGSGKSTLINLIPRFFDPTKGEVLLNGTNIKNVKLHDLRKKIGYVPQKGMLFSGTIGTNIKYASEDITDEQMEKAAEIAQATEFIYEKTQKYNSSIAQGGTNVSGGQRQRLSIARAIAPDPEVYIFDDSFSALDFKTDAELRRALNKETKDSTILIVAQRISTVLNAEQIIVLDQGTIVGKGTHKELLENCPVYQQIAESQLSKEELM